MAAINTKAPINGMKRIAPKLSGLYNSSLKVITLK